MSSPPTKSAPASCASFSFSPEATTSTFLALPPRPWGRMTVPRTIWSACLGSTPRRSATSTVSSNLAKACFATVATASGSGYCGFAATASCAFANFFPTFDPSTSPFAPCLGAPTARRQPSRARWSYGCDRLADLDAHAARGALARSASPPPGRPRSGRASSAWRSPRPASCVILPTLFLFGSPLPLAMPASRLIRTATGGVLVMKV